MIANRGEIACRVIRTAKRMGIPTVAVYSEADAEAPHVTMADEAACIGPPPVRESYLSVARLVAVAKERRVGAVHPGYGLLSENAGFARALADAGVRFVGPPPAVLEAFGDKIRARAVAREAGVSPPPGSDGPIAADDADAVRAAAERIGFPVLVKAAGGGGGIGMQIVHKDQQLARAVASCSDRGKSAFGDARVYLERYVTSPKHIEVQVLCDGHGRAVAIGDRECSLQRRHQKIIEEAPSAAPFFAGPDGAQRREELHRAAVAVVTHAEYRGAGTVEFVATPSGELFFLEVNARLQVEHCVTEMCAGVDLVEQQLRIAAGLPMTDAALGDELSGHAIEARIYAEDPARMFVPQPGKIAKLVWPAEQAWLRVEAGYREGMEITPYYDPLIAKLVAHATTRTEAIARLDRALGETQLELSGAAGPAATNLAFCRRLLATPSFVDGSYHTGVAEALAKGSA